jgi:hypothetical protein
LGRGDSRCQLFSHKRENSTGQARGIGKMNLDFC